MQGNQAHAARAVSGKTLHCHICHDIAAVLDIGRFTERRVRTADIVMVASQHDGADFSVAYHLIEAQGYIHASHGILIKDTRLRADYQIVLLRIANPIVVIQILPATCGVDTFHRRTVGLHQVFMFSTEAHPAERTITIIKQFRSHYVFHIAGKDEAVLIISVPSNFAHAGIVDGFHEGVTIIEEVRAVFHQPFYSLEMTLQGSIHQTPELRRILVQHMGTLLKRQSDGTVTALVGGMAGSLVGK